MSSPTRQVIRAAVNDSFKGLFIADAVAMPVHWYYNVDLIKRDFNGWISRYEKPKDHHPTSILRLSNTSGSGRTGGKKAVNIIGDVILTDKLDAWSGRTNKNHYHQDMSAGDNTLNSQCALLAMSSLHQVKNSTVDDDAKLKRIFSDYVEFMITPKSHNDTYAESWHRSFFAGWVNAGRPQGEEEIYDFLQRRSKEKLKCEPDHQLEVIGAFVMPTSIILHNIHRPLHEVIDVTKKFVRLTHPVASLEDPLESYIRVLHNVVRGSSLRDEVERELSVKYGSGSDNPLNRITPMLSDNYADNLALFQQVVQRNGMACYIEGALLNAYLIAAAFHRDFEQGILINVNAGGENCHRGSVVGALLGAASGAAGSNLSATQWWKDLSLGVKISACLSD